MEALTIAKAINTKIIELERLKNELPKLSHSKAQTAAVYEKEVARETAILATQNPMSIIDKLVRGKCADLKCTMDLAEGAYKNALKIIDLTEAQLNGYQSINRYLSEV